MNKQEVAAVLAYFSAAFPNMDLSNDTADVWAFELRDIDPDLAPEAMRKVVQSSEFAPTIAKFREACRVIAYHERVAHPVPELPAGPEEDPADPKACIAEMRAALEAARTKNRSPRTA